MKRPAVILLQLLLFLPLAAATAAVPGSEAAPGQLADTGLEVLYIEANTGDSSGGHAGFRFADQVFHYQYGDHGLLVLQRESWEEFRSFYNDLGNRTIFSARLDLAPASVKSIRDHFTLELLHQDTRREQLEQARNRVRLLTALAEGKDLPRNLRAAGFFGPEKNAGGRAAAQLRQAVVKQFGADFFDRQYQQLHQALSRLPDSQAAFVAWHEQRSRLTALEIIDQQRGLDPQTLIEAPGEKGQNSLSRPERIRLTEYQKRFRRTVIQLLNSPRPDRGFPLMLATARYLAAARSLATGRLLLLDACPPKAETIDPLYQAGSRKLLLLLARRSRREAAARRRSLLSAAPGNRKISEFAWCRLENAATRCHELEAAAAGRPSMRVYPGNAIPARPGAGARPEGSFPTAAAARLPRARQELANLKTEIEHRYGYNLFTRNCVTELFATLARALPPADRAGPNAAFTPQERKLINSISFIPWQMFAEVKKGLHPAAVTCHPALRRRYLAELYRRKPELFVYLKECNTLTSSLYRAGGQDDAFLFYTDEAVPLRPLYGAVNLAWALPRAAFGLLSWPFDHGRELKRGLYGTLFSLPELFFINLRKGSFILVPPGLESG
jgi:hypothetical protein